MMLDKINSLFEAGALERAVIAPGVLDNSSQWQLLIYKKNDKQPVLMTTQRQHVRHFKTLDAAFRMVRKVGFQDAVVTAGGSQ